MEQMFIKNYLITQTLWQNFLFDEVTAGYEYYKSNSLEVLYFKGVFKNLPKFTGQQ